jgi:hypothetical protein
MDFITKTLRMQVSDQATYMQQGKHGCHKNTRDRILHRLNEWLTVPSETERCWWITGQPGVGKSAIAVTVSNCLRARRPISAYATPEVGYVPRATLFGQFFIHHSLSNNPDKIFPTIAKDLAETSPVAAVLIHDALKADQTLAEKLSKEQVDALYVRPLTAIAKHNPGVIVSLFDGIDELSNADEETLSSFTVILLSAAALLPSNVKLLVFSRPESHIIDQIASDRFTGSIRRSDLFTEESREDVRRLLQADLAGIAELWQLPNWPLEEHIGLLCEFASGHLGWAALAVRWIGQEVRRERDSVHIRETVFEQVKTVQKGNLYDLYEFILTRVIPIDSTKVEKERYQKIFGTLAILQTPQTIATITSLLGAKYDTTHYFRRISSIIDSGLEAVNIQTIPRPHKSFFDWICSDANSRFYVDVKTQHKDLSVRCLEILKTSFYFNMVDPVTLNTIVPLEQCDIEVDGPHWERPRLPLYDHLDPSIVYSCTSLFHHIAEAGQLRVSAELKQLVSEFRVRSTLTIVQLNHATTSNVTLHDVGGYMLAWGQLAGLG